MKRALAVLAAAAAVVGTLADTPLVVSTKQGAVRGAVSPYGFQYFKGIPFAASTAPPNRFLPPKPRAPWSGVLNATSFGPGCVQNHHNADVPPQQSEDCLNLNVYAPAGTQGGAGLPVMAFIHGGAFEEGSGRGPFDMYEANYIVQQHDVVYVTLQYRLGAFGWLALGEGQGVPGNMGLLDQRAALEWVQENIAAFGGDPAAVTLQGESAGAMSIGLHMVSPGSKGLFHRVIQESGVTGYPYRDSSEQAMYGANFCKAVKCDVGSAAASATPSLRGQAPLPTTTPAEWLPRLALMTPAHREEVARAVLGNAQAATLAAAAGATTLEELLEDLPALAEGAPTAMDAAVAGSAAQAAATSCNVTCLQGLTLDQVKTGAKTDVLTIAAANWGHWFSAFLSFTPTVDGTIVPSNPVPALTAGEFVKDVDVLVTTNTNEGATFIYAAIDFDVPPLLMPLAYEILFNKEAEKNISANPLYDAKLYPDGRTPLSHLTTDHLFRCPAQLWGGAVDAAGSTAWVGRFNHQWSFSWLLGKFGLPKICISEVCHASELPGVFHAGNTTLRQNNVTFTPEEEALSASMVQYWTNFAATGNPNTYPTGRDARHPLPLQWPAWSNDNQVDLSLNTTWVTETSPQCEMWNAIGYHQKND